MACLLKKPLIYLTNRFMKNSKRLYGLATLMVAFLFMVGLTFTGNEALAESTECYWKQYDCDQPDGGTYEACLTIGDGNSCSECGGVTRECGGTGEA